MVLLPLLLLPLQSLSSLLLLLQQDLTSAISFQYSRGLAYPGLKSCLVTASQLLEAIVSLLLEVWLLLYLCLVETVDDGVLALGDQDALYFAGVLEADLADLHAAVFL